jgi:DNA-binding XRE family transcriptional regulator
MARREIEIPENRVICYAGSYEIRGFDHTQREFGKLLGIGQTHLSKYEKGQSVPTLELLLRLKTHSGRSIDWIVTGEEAARFQHLIRFRNNDPPSVLYSPTGSGPGLPAATCVTSALPQR